MGDAPPRRALSSLAQRLRRASFKPIYFLYYLALFDRRFPGSVRISKWVRDFELRTARGDVPRSASVWDSEYANRQWEFLKGAGELARYVLIAEYLKLWKPGGRVLDVGCGDGTLLESLGSGPGRVTSYVGIDVSEVAIAAARDRGHDNASFEVVDAAEYRPAQTFDAIVLNECLYYFHDPLGTVQRLTGFLEEDGLLAISAFQSARTKAILQRLERLLPVVESLQIARQSGAWRLIFLRRPPKAP